MFKMLKNFIVKLQNSDDAIKKVWLVVLSGVTMVIVISLWMVYLNSSLITKVGPSANPVAQKETAPTKKIESDEPGFLAIFGAGVKTIFDQVKTKFLSVKNIVIESPERNFVAEEVEPIPPTKLP